MVTPVQEMSPDVLVFSTEMIGTGQWPQAFIVLEQQSCSLAKALLPLYPKVQCYHFPCRASARELEKPFFLDQTQVMDYMNNCLEVVAATCLFVLVCFLLLKTKREAITLSPLKPLSGDCIFNLSLVLRFPFPD